MRLLITGATGFVGGRLLENLLGANDGQPTATPRSWPQGCTLGATTRNPDAASEGAGTANRAGDGAGNVEWLRADLLEPEGFQRVVAQWKPDRVLHLAAMAHPGDCEDDPKLAFDANVEGTRALLSALEIGRARALVVSTAQVYGVPANGALREDDELRAHSVYGLSKLEAERVALEFADKGLDVCIARPFNHSGRGQSTRYVLPALAAGLIRAARSGDVMPCGNMAPKRDFLHVDDVLDAYGLLLERGARGQVVNVCSGRAVAIGDLLERLKQRLAPDARCKTDPERVRSDDPPLIVGDPARLESLGWSAARSLDELLDEIAASAKQSA